jgi:hypothetical protein
MADTTGANAVAEAVKRVADVAVQEVARAKAGQSGPPVDLQASGSAGGKLVILGSGFGASGTVKINGVQVETTAWSASRIEGRVPAGTQSGEVLVHVDDKITKRGRIQL